MSDESPIICPHCNAKQIGPSEDCWLCHQSLQASSFSAPAPANVEEPWIAKEPESLSFSLATLFLIITLASVCMGLLVTLPGLGIIACIIMVPVFIRTARVVRHREKIGENVSPLQKVLMFSTSFALSSVLVIIVCVSAFCSFCGVCLTIFGAGGGDGGALAWGIGMCVGAVVGIVVIVQMVRWFRRRYQREMGRE